MANNSVQVWITASSPLLDYTPSRNGVVGSGWVQGNGQSQCQGSDVTFAVELDSIYFTNLAFYYTSSGSYSIQVGLDGSLQSSTSSSTSSLNSSFGSHTARLECSCSSSCSSSDTFDLIGVIITTEVVSSGMVINSTLDDASSSITYSGFQSTSSSQSSISAIQSGSFYQDTISYTSSQGASATFSFKGSALYIFGMTGPEFGSFQITLDSNIIGKYNASTTVETYDTLLFFTTALNDGTHQVVIENMNEEMILALDYIVAVQSSSSGTGTVGGGETIGSRTTSTAGSSATAVFGGGSNGNDNGDSGGAVIGGILGGLAALALLFFWWRYHLRKKGGGEGSFVTALCGAMRKPLAAPNPEAKKFHLWPMIHSQPKYATN